MWSDSLYQVLLSGGPVMVPIFLVGMLAFYLLLQIILRFGPDWRRGDYEPLFHAMEAELRAGEFDQVVAKWRKSPGLVVPAIGDYVASGIGEGHQKKVLLQWSREAERNAGLMAAFATSAPLLGLLGTVTGMVTTFHVITTYGNSNPVLLAGGISEALITTQSGLLLAFPLVLLKQRLEERIAWVNIQLIQGLEHAARWQGRLNDGTL